MHGRPAVFLDRDGVLNCLVTRDGGAYSPRCPEEFHLFPWTVEALNLLANHGFLLVVVTNQPDIARGQMSIDDLQEMHQTLRSRTQITDIYICPHDSSDDCECRKPRPGMFFRAVTELGIELAASWTIGDRESDLSAGRAAGTRLIHVSSGQELHRDDADVVSLSDLLAAAKYIVKTISTEH